MKRAWDPARLTVNFWEGPPPQPGDTLRTRTGRQYLVRGVRFAAPAIRYHSASTTPTALDVVVLPKDEPATGQVFEWTWSPRTRKATR